MPLSTPCAAWRHALIALGLALGLACSAGTAWAQKRVALVIGNAAYVGQKPLKNPGNDAADVAALLRRAGLQTTVLTDQGRSALNDAVSRFLADAEGAELAVVYYSGHGMQAQGESYLIPVDARINTERDLRTEALRLGDLMDDLEARRIRHTLLVLDACRDNPFRSRTKSAARGLAPPKEMNGAFMVAYAAADGRTADDGDGRNGAYTAELLKQLAQRGKSLRDMLEDTQLAVEASTQGQQRPKNYGDTARFRSLVLLAGEGPGPERAEQQAWEAAQRAHSLAGYNAFLAEFPSGRYAGAARVARAGLAPGPVPEPRPGPAPVLQPQPGQVVKDCSECPELVVIPAGEFTMGSPASEPGRDSDEGPQRRVKVGGFLAGRYEVTFEQWDACVAAGGCSHKPEDRGWGRGKRPVIDVSWEDAQQYVKWLSGKTGKGYRLLSEAEWEYVARAGTSTPFWTGQTISAAQANFNGNYTYNGSAKGEYRPKTVPVGSFGANGFGLYETSGNAWEWVQDVWHDNYSGAPSDGSAWMSGGDQTRRVLRGGSWDFIPQFLRSAYRISSSPVSHIVNPGFRIARTY